LGTLDRPLHELGFVHVGTESGHDPYMRRVLNESAQRDFVVPLGDCPESSRKRAGKKGIAKQFVNDEGDDPPVAFQWRYESSATKSPSGFTEPNVRHGIAGMIPGFYRIHEAAAQAARS